jgi:hypothetical protein
MTTFDFYPEIQSSRFVDIDQLEHRFPNNVKELGVSVTLLHSHHHCKKNQVLVFESNFKESSYHTYEEAVKNYFPCSWLLF